MTIFLVPLHGYAEPQRFLAFDEFAKQHVRDYAAKLCELMSAIELFSDDKFVAGGLYAFDNVLLESSPAGVEKIRTALKDRYLNFAANSFLVRTHLHNFPSQRATQIVLQELLRAWESKKELLFIMSDANSPYDSIERLESWSVVFPLFFSYYLESSDSSWREWTTPAVLFAPRLNEFSLAAEQKPEERWMKGLARALTQWVVRNAFQRWGLKQISGHKDAKWPDLGNWLGRFQKSAENEKEIEYTPNASLIKLFAAMLYLKEDAENSMITASDFDVAHQAKFYLIKTETEKQDLDAFLSANKLTLNNLLPWLLDFLEEYSPASLL